MALRHELRHSFALQRRGRKDVQKKSEGTRRSQLSRWTDSNARPKREWKTRKAFFWLRAGVNIANQPWEIIELSTETNCQKLWITNKIKISRGWEQKLKKKKKSFLIAVAGHGTRIQPATLQVILSFSPKLWNMDCFVVLSIIQGSTLTSSNHFLPTIGCSWARGVNEMVSGGELLDSFSQAFIKFWRT